MSGKDEQRKRRFMALSNAQTAIQQALNNVLRATYLDVYDPSLGKLLDMDSALYGAEQQLEGALHCVKDIREHVTELIAERQG